MPVENPDPQPGGGGGNNDGGGGGESDNPFESGGGGGGGGGGSSSGGSSSGGSSSSGSSEPAIDPVVAQKMNLFRGIYIQIWGEPPTEAYLKSAANSGLNTMEFAEQERMKPAYSKTKEYRDRARAAADLLVNLGVA